MSKRAQTEERRSKRQQGDNPEPVALFKSPAKEVKRLLQAYPGIESLQHQQTSTLSTLAVPGARRGSWSGSSGNGVTLQTTGGRISPGIQERIQTLEAASSSAAADSGPKTATPEPPETESDSDSSD